MLPVGLSKRIHAVSKRSRRGLASRSFVTATTSTEQIFSLLLLKGSRDSQEQESGADGVSSPHSDLCQRVFVSITASIKPGGAGRREEDFTWKCSCCPSFSLPAAPFALPPPFLTGDLFIG